MEVEAKFRLKDGVLEKIEKIASFVEEKEEFDVYFIHPCRDFAKTDEALRLRVEKNVKMTYKGPKIDSETKTREEINVLIDDFEKAVRLLEALGFKKFRCIRKTRKIFSIEDAIVCVDHVEGLGDFIEVEVKSLAEKEKIFRIAERLGYSREESIRASYLELILEKSNGKV